MITSYAGDYVTFNSIQKIIFIAFPYRMSITGGLAQFSVHLKSQVEYAFSNKYVFNFALNVSKVCSWFRISSGSEFQSFGPETQKLRRAHFNCSSSRHHKVTAGGRPVGLESRIDPDLRQRFDQIGRGIAVQTLESEDADAYGICRRSRICSQMMLCEEWEIRCHDVTYCSHWMKEMKY